MDNLNKLRIFTTENIFNFKGLRKDLGLITEGMDVMKPNDYAYVFGGYAPISIRLIHEAVKNEGFSSENSEGNYTNIFNTQKDAPTIKFEQSGTKKSSRRRVYLIFFLGGITFAEISALRWLGHHSGNVEFLIATTHIVNGNSLIRSLMTPIGKSPFVNFDDLNVPSSSSSSPSEPSESSQGNLPFKTSSNSNKKPPPKGFF